MAGQSASLKTQRMTDQKRSIHGGLSWSPRDLTMTIDGCVPEGHKIIPPNIIARMYSRLNRRETQDKNINPGQNLSQIQQSNRKPETHS
jgi:hypothetical protein